MPDFSTRGVQPSAQCAQGVSVPQPRMSAKDARGCRNSVTAIGGDGTGTSECWRCGGEGEDCDGGGGGGNACVGGMYHE